MVALYVVSSEEAAGKTAICAGLGKHLLDDGKKVGFFKPIISDKRPEAGDDRDAVFMKQILDLSEPADSLCPLVGEGGTLSSSKVKEAYAKVSRGKDVVIMEGTCGESPDDAQSKDSYQIAGALDARVIIVKGYANQSPVTKFVDIYKGFGKNLLGLVMNKVPASKLMRVCEELTSSFSESELSILGVLPENRSLLSLTIGELANYVQGEILNNAEKSAELVENFMVEAMYVDSGLEYFGRKSDKAVVVRDNRPDAQLAALETPTKCLIISGTNPPIYSVRYRAENKGIPVILTGSDPDSIIQAIENALAKGKFSQEEKLPELSEIMERHLGFKSIYKGLGLSS